MDDTKRNTFWSTDPDTLGDQLRDAEEIIRQLAGAYVQGNADGGSVDWDDLDVAYNAIDNTFPDVIRQAKLDHYTDPVTCDNCGDVFELDALDAIDDIHERLAPGEVYPAGQCPEPSCGAIIGCTDKNIEGAGTVSLVKHMLIKAGYTITDPKPAAKKAPAKRKTAK